MTRRAADLAGRAAADILYALGDLVPEARHVEVLAFMGARRRQLPAPVRIAHAGLTLWFRVVWTALAALACARAPLVRRAWCGRWVQRMPTLRGYCAWHRLLGLYGARAARLAPPSAPPRVATLAPGLRRVRNLVIGSGPGGSATAAVLGEAGEDALVLEEGPAVNPDARVLSPEETPLYRAGGMTFTLGRPMVNYVEGRCVGGGGEINLGIYYRTPPAVLCEWTVRLGLPALEAPRVDAWFASIERALEVDFDPPLQTPVVAYLQRGAASLGLACAKIALSGRARAGSRRPEPTAAAARLVSPRTDAHLALASGRVMRLRTSPGGVTATVVSDGALREVLAERVFVCGGAVQTAHLLRRSGLAASVGRTLSMNLVVKVVAVFPEDVHDGSTSVAPVHVRDPSTGAVFGGSVSTPELLAVNLANHPPALREVTAQPRRWLLFHVSVHGDGVGRFLRLPGLADPMLRLAWGRPRRERLTAEVSRLVQMLLAGGAERVYLNVPHSQAFTRLDQARALTWDAVGRVQWISSYHLSSSCPMQVDGPVDAFGRLACDRRVRLCDASALPTCVGVNPQGTVMMIARRNTEHALAEA